MQDEKHLALIIVFASLAMMIVAWAIILLTVMLRKKMIEKEKIVQQMELEKKLLVFKSVSAAEEKERERIARNLHDEINVMLAIHKQNMENHGLKMSKNKFDLEAYTSQIENIEKIREAVSACAGDLAPAFFLKNGLITSLEDHIRNIHLAGNIEARFNCLLSNPKKSHFENQEELNIYRICLELLNNVLKHSRPDFITMSLRMAGNEFQILIDHNGKKIDNATVSELRKNSKGLGMNSIYARSMLLNAIIEYSVADAGPAIKFVVPIKK